MENVIHHLRHSNEETFRYYLRDNMRYVVADLILFLETVSQDQIAHGPYPHGKMDIIFDMITDAKIIKTEEDILSLIREVQAKELETVIFVTRQVSIPKMMMRYGLFPSYREMSVGKHLWDYMRDMTESNLSFWHPTFFSHGDPFMHVYTWRYESLSIHLDRVETSSESLALSILSDEEYQYVFHSGRARTKMSMYMEARSRTAPRSQLQRINNITYYTLGNITYRAIPVTRYQDDMSDNIYYLEEESSVYILCDPSRVLVSPCKTKALLDLGADIPISKINPLIMAHMSGNLPHDLQLTPQELASIDPAQKRRLLSIHPEPLPIKEYTGASIGLHGIEDSLDHPLRDMAIKKGIDIIILTHIPDKYQVTTKIIDTRSTSDSISSLLFILD